jgi:hypothetical protein
MPSARFVAAEQGAPAHAPPPPALVDVQLVGTAYSGSTLLGNALNAHEAIAHVGEVSSLPAFGIGPPERACHLCAATGRDCPVWTPETIALLAERGPVAAADVLREATAAPVIVDSSKWVPWLHATGPEERLERRRVVVILTVRSPLAFVESVHRRDGAEVWLAANLWRDTMFDALRSVGRMSLPTMVIRYEDLALEPEPTLTRVCRALGLEFDPCMLEFWNIPVHALGGNAGAFVWYPGYRHRGRSADKGTWREEDAAIADAYRERGFGGWVDDKWRTMLGEDARRAVLATPMLADLATLVGYHVHDLAS